MLQQVAQKKRYAVYKWTKFGELAWFVDHQLLRDTEDAEEKGQETAESSSTLLLVTQLLRGTLATNEIDPTRGISEGTPFL